MDMVSTCMENLPSKGCSKPKSLIAHNSSGSSDKIFVVIWAMEGRVGGEGVLVEAPE